MEEGDFRGLSIGEACRHKSWKARLHGCKELAELLGRSSAEECKEYSGLLKNLVTDSNAFCQEKGLEIAATFLDKPGTEGGLPDEVITGIVQKCLAASKVRTRELATEVVLKYSEKGNISIAIEELKKGTESKNPKVSAASLQLLKKLFEEFGRIVSNIDGILERAAVLAEDRDKGVREASKSLILQICHWFGDEIIKKLKTKLNATRLTEIETEYREKKIVIPKCQLRIAKDVKLDEGLSEPVNILNLLKANKEFYENLNSNKWKDRKDSLDKLIDILDSATLLEKGNYYDLLQSLTRIVYKDSNVCVVASAATCISKLAKGLGKGFLQFANFVVPILLEKFKEKKQNVVLALRDAVDSVSQACQVKNIKEFILISCLDKNPFVRAEVAGFISRCVTEEVDSHTLNELCMSVVNFLSDQDPNVRESGGKALQSIINVVGHNKILHVVNNVDQATKQKVNKVLGNCEIFIGKPAEAQALTPIVKKPEINQNTKSIKRNASSAKKEVKSATKFKQPQLSPEQLSPISFDSISEELNSKNWDVRQNVIKKLQNMITSNTPGLKLDDFSQLIAAKIMDVNINVCTDAMTLVDAIARKMGTSCSKMAPIFLPNVLKNLGHQKAPVRMAAISCLNTWSDCYGLHIIFKGMSFSEALKTGSPNAQAEIWDWLSSKLLSFPAKSLHKDELTACLGPMFNHLLSKNKDLKAKSSKAAAGFMKHLGYKVMVDAIDHLVEGPSSIKTIKDIMDRTRADLAAGEEEPSEVIRRRFSKVYARRGSKMQENPSDVSIKFNETFSLSEEESSLEERKDDTDQPKAISIGCNTSSTPTSKDASTQTSLIEYYSTVLNSIPVRTPLKEKNLAYQAPIDVQVLRSKIKLIKLQLGLSIEDKENHCSG